MSTRMFLSWNIENLRVWELLISDQSSIFKSLIVLRSQRSLTTIKTRHFPEIFSMIFGRARENHARGHTSNDEYERVALECSKKKRNRRPPVINDDPLKCNRAICVLKTKYTAVSGRCNHYGNTNFRRRYAYSHGALLCRVKKKNEEERNNSKNMNARVYVSGVETEIGEWK